MLKKTGILFAGLLMSISTLRADGQMSSATDTTLYSGGFVAGMGLTTLQDVILFGSGTGTVFELGYYGTCWMVDVGFSVSGASKFDRSATLLLGHLGLRNRIYENLFVSYGAMGTGNIVSHVPHLKSNHWSVGAFAGLDYQLSKHYMLSGKIYPYNYEHRASRYLNNIFSNGTLSLLYVF
jgi:hypothetical protein